MGNFCQFLEKCPFSGKSDLWNKRPPRGSRSHSVYTVGHSRFDCVSFCPGVRNGEKSPHLFPEIDKNCPFFQKLSKIALFSRNCPKCPRGQKWTKMSPGDKNCPKKHPLFVRFPVLYCNLPVTW